MGVTIDEKISWSPHLTDVKNNFVNKPPEKELVLEQNALLEVYFKITLLSVLYGLGCLGRLA